MKELPWGWVEAKFGELLELKYGKALPDKARDGHGFPVFGSNGIVGNHSVPLTNNETLIVGRKGSVGEVQYSAGPCSPIDTTYYVDYLWGMPFRFWLYYLRHLKLQDLNKATAVPGLSREDAYRLPIHLAPLNEQKRIADKLDSLLARVDDCRERLALVPQMLKRFRQAVLAAATSGALTEGWRKKRKLKTASAKMLSEIVTLKTGPFGSVLHKEDYVENGVPVINPMHINNGIITPTSSISISARKADELKEFRLKKGDVIIARRGVMGRCAVVTEVEDNWLCGTGSMVLRSTKDLAPAYLQICLSSPDVVSTLEHRSVGSTMINLNQNILLGLEMSIPSISEQREIVRRVETFFAFADRLEARYSAACVQVENMTPALLAKAFRGELVPQDLNDEPANELLKRIKGQKTNVPEQKRKPRANTKKNERHMNTKAITTFDELVSVLDQLGGEVMADRLAIESGLSDDIDRFFELLREGRNKFLDVPVGSNKPIRRIVDANQ